MAQVQQVPQVHTALVARIDRARCLAREREAAADLLTFYADLADFQQSLLHEQAPLVLRAPHTGEFADALDAHGAAMLVPRLVQWLGGRPQQGLAGVGHMLRERTIDGWEALLDGYWRSGGVALVDVNEVEQFVAEAVLQPFAETVARSRGEATQSNAHATELQVTSRCRACGGHPIVATLREHGHGARRSLVCGFCLTEWPAPRVTCPCCGEDESSALFVYRAEEFADVRIDACCSCETFIKTIDLAVNGAAIHVVDDLASIAMDLWAAGRGYRKLRPNLLRL